MRRLLGKQQIFRVTIVLNSVPFLLRLVHLQLYGIEARVLLDSVPVPEFLQPICLAVCIFRCNTRRVELLWQIVIVIHFLLFMEGSEDIGEQAVNLDFLVVEKSLFHMIIGFSRLVYACATGFRSSERAPVKQLRGSCSPARAGNYIFREEAARRR